MTARTPEVEKAYQDAKASGNLEQLHEVAPIKEWTYWKLIPNRFPHNKLNTKHMMIVLKRGCDIWSLTNYEIYELWREILPELDDQYDYVKLNLSAMRTVAGTPHLHVCIYKQEYRS